MTAATFALISGGAPLLLELTAGDKPTAGVPFGARYVDQDGVEWLNAGDATTADWVQITTATFAGTVATVDQGDPGAQSWPVKVDGWSFTNIVLAAPTTTVVKSGAGVLHGITINTPVISAVITLYDNTAASGTKIGTITLPATLLAQGPYTALYDVAFATGLTVRTATGACDLTVAYR